jgi:hypothetical protein
VVAAMGALLFVSTGELSPQGGDRARVAKLIAAFATATTSFSEFTKLWSSALNLQCKSKRRGSPVGISLLIRL